MTAKAKIKNPYKVVLNRRVTEKAVVLEQLQSADSNPCVKRCENPKYVFDVHPQANKGQIAAAVEEIYSSFNIKVVKVNTINVKRKPRRVRGRPGFKAAQRKAIVTLEPGDSIDNV